MKDKKEEVAQIVDRLASQILGLNKKIAANPELGFEEFKASSWLTEMLEQGGFQVERGIAGLETAFRASYRWTGSGPAIALLCEYDALPGIGHGCGHNFIASASLGAALALQQIDGLAGELLVFGCPGEETGGGKVIMVEEGCFDRVDIAMMVHPATVNRVYSTSLAIDAYQFVFSGKTAHAASAPEEGINALDGVLHLFNGINALRQYVKDDVRIHGIITEGGQAPNVIPDRAAARFYIRAREREYLDRVVNRVLDIARGAALISGAEVNWKKYELSNDNLKPNKRLAETFRANFSLLGIEDQPPGEGNGSTDMGNVSQLVPAIHPYIAITDRSEVTAHTRKFAEASISSKGEQALINAAKAMAFTALDLYNNKGLVNQIKQEFIREKGMKKV